MAARLRSSFSCLVLRFNLQALKDKQKEPNQNHPDKKESAGWNGAFEVDSVKQGVKLS